jgi:Tol biopolymer transport system component
MTLALGAVMSGQARPAEIELAAAIRTETVDGDVAAAVKLYTAFVEKYKTSDRAQAAQGLLKLAQLHERQGSVEAERVYARIVSEFSDQPAAAEARVKMAARSGSSPSTASTTRALRLVYTGTSNAMVSPDGRFLAHDGSTDGLAVRELSTGRETTYQHSGYEWAFSRDSAQLAYGRCLVAAVESGVCEVRVVRLGSTEAPRAVFKSDAGYAGVIDWSPDGRTIAIFVNRTADRTLQFGLLNPATREFRVLKTVGWGGAVRGAFSPDGQDIVINAHMAEHAGKRDIVLMAVDASREVPLVTGPADEFALGWTPDGKFLLFGSDSTGSVNIWAQPIADRRPQGSPKLVASDVGVSVAGVGVTRSGALYLGRRSSTNVAEVVPVDLSTGKRTGASSRPVRTVANSIAAPSWSPDGKSLVYTMRRSGDYLIGTRSMATGVEREMNLSMSLNLINSYVSWAPDGSFVAYGRDLKGRYGVFRIDLNSSKVTPLVFRGPQGRAGVEGFFWSPDGTRMYYRTATGGHGPIVERDVASGDERTIAEGQFRSMSLSPDGRLFAVTTAEKLTLVPVAGGERRDLLTGPFRGNAQWSPDGRSVIVSRMIDPQKPEGLLVPIDGSAPRPLDFDVAELRINPDGRSIVYTAGERILEVVALENFMAALRGGR